ncbi:succinate semialdehyde dehydrogenase NADP+ linked [Sporothrix eucalyptigena]|uniref:Succinate semialdehyde dehydrogenase NADP+ linked n=1 Tax=Sporothrix eucalyptigena TaxID=1812306 RepID=A0ABP0BTC7_9PEZI
MSIVSNYGRIPRPPKHPDTKDTEAAIDHAAKAFETFRHKTGRERSKLLRRWYDLMMENADGTLSRIVTNT